MRSSPLSNSLLDALAESGLWLFALIMGLAMLAYLAAKRVLDE